MNVAFRACVTAGRVRRAAGDDRKRERVNQHFSLELLIETSAWILDWLARYRIGRVFFKLADTRRHRRQFFQRNGGELPRHGRRVDLKEGKSEILSCAQKDLGGRENDARLFGAKVRAPPRFAD